MQWIFYKRKDNLLLYVYLPLIVKEPLMKYSSSFKLSNVLYKIFIIFYQITPLTGKNVITEDDNREEIKWLG